MGKVVSFQEAKHASFMRAFEGSSQRVQDLAAIVSQRSIELSEYIMSNTRKEDERQRSFEILRAEIELELDG